MPQGATGDVMHTHLAVIGCVLGVAAPAVHAQQLVWAGRIASSAQFQQQRPTPTTAAVDGFGNVLFGGYFGGTTDFDPSPTSTYELTASCEAPFVCKLDKDGHFIWAAQFTGSGSGCGGDNERVRGVAVDSNGNVYSTGEFYYTMDFDPGPGTAYLSSSGFSDAFVSKLNSAGTYVWATKLAMRPTDYESGTAIVTDAGNNVYVSGENGTPDLFIYKLSPGGMVLWTTVVGRQYSARAIAVDKSGNVYSAGWSYNTGGSGFISKVDSSGNVVWVKLLPRAAYGVAVDSQGNVFATGDFFGTSDFDPGPGVHNLTAAGGYDIFVEKLNSAGSFVWAGQLSGTSDEHALGLALDTNGTIVVTGSFVGTVDFNPGAGVFPLTSQNAGQTNAFYCKLTNSGAFVWAAQMPALVNISASSVGRVVAVRPDRTVNIVGTFGGTVDFDPGPTQAFLTSSATGTDAFVAKYFDTLCIDLDGNGTSDNDGDGLCDNWEMPGGGIDLDQDGTIDLDLWNYDVNKDGVVTDDERPNINVKDVYVEIDWMERHEPSWDEINKVVNSFAQAGCDDGPPCAASGGIRLHVQKDEQVLSHATNVGWSSFGLPPNAGDSDFDAIKSLEFGTDAERLESTKAAKTLVFHYGLFAHKLSHTSWSGLGEGGGSVGAGNDFMVTLGAWWVLDNFPGKRVSEAFMHELGHNLGLLHGGGDGTDCKPNYLSVMNLMFMNDGDYVDGRPLDYSRAALSTLNETALDEVVGIGGASGRRTAHGPPHCLGSDNLCVKDNDCWPLWCVNHRNVDASSAIDWNTNGSIDAALVIRDINHLKGNHGCGASVPNASSPLTPFNDWKNVRFDFRSNCFWTDSCFNSGLSSTLGGPPPPDERTYEDVLEGADTDADGVSNVVDTCPSLADPDQVNSDGDPYGDVCDCNPLQSAVYPGAVEVNDGVDNQCPGEIGYGLIDEIDGDRFATHTSYSWDAQERATLYNVVRSSRPDFASCSLISVNRSFWDDTEVPPAGSAFFYIVRAGAPNVGTWGKNSLGNDRSPACE